MSIIITERSVEEGLKLSRQLFQDYSIHWNGDEPNQGMHRPGYSLQESEAHDSTVGQMRLLGTEIYQDLAGNTYIVKPGKNRNMPAVISGSHLDAVPHGGRYDGPAGVVIACAAIAAMDAQNIIPPQDYVAVIWRNEESPWFGGQFAVGSKLAVGQLKSDFLRAATQRDTGHTLFMHMDDIGLNPAALTKALDIHGFIFPEDHIARSIEFHIEQGENLLEANKGLGIVDKIRASLRYPEYIAFTGRAAHTGSTPMHKRSSASLAIANFIVNIEQRFGEELIKQGHDLVYEPSIIETPGASQTSVCKLSRMKFDIRSVDIATLQEARNIIIEEANKAAQQHNCSTNIETTAAQIGKPQSMSGDLNQVFSGTADKYGISHMSMPSGAQHDICNLTGVWQRAMVFLRHNGISHHPDESLGMPEKSPLEIGSDFANAIRLLTDIAMQPAGKRETNGTSFVDELLKLGARAYECGCQTLKYEAV